MKDMNKFFQRLGYILVGLGGSLVVGYWLRREEFRSRETPSPTEDERIILSSKTLDAIPEEQAPQQSPQPETKQDVEPNVASQAPEEKVPDTTITPTPQAENTDQTDYDKQDVIEGNTQRLLASAPELAQVDPDDLTKISGIGAKTAEVLQSLDIQRYDQLAAISAETLYEQLRGKVRGISQEKVQAWIQQAAELAN